MRKMILVFAAAVSLAGCNTVTLSSAGSLDGIEVKGAGGKAERVISVGTDAYFFLWTIPLVAGNMTEWDASHHCLRNNIKWFSNESSLQNLHKAMFRYAEDLNCDVTDIVVCDRSVSRTGLWSMEGWFNGIIGLRPISVSGVLVPRK